ncbi:hypothetical protein QE152_g18162 [Popillia japonica]|uniref:Uncharacterized protein n=1 Tax=Popillia japonica TaxID=7064 RepID=A0AAW1L5M6_POPJA
MTSSGPIKLIASPLGKDGKLQESGEEEAVIWPGLREFNSRGNTSHFRKDGKLQESGEEEAVIWPGLSLTPLKSSGLISQMEASLLEVVIWPGLSLTPLKSSGLISQMEASLLLVYLRVRYWALCFFSFK